MKLLLDCDEVFDALTSNSSAEFSTAGCEDTALQEHLENCPDCRQFAQEVGPAVTRFQAALEEFSDPAPVDKNTSRSLADCVLDRFEAEEQRVLHQTQRRSFLALTAHAWSQLGAAAAVLIALGGLLWATSPGIETAQAAIPHFPSQLSRASAPSEHGLLHLASPELPDGCVNLASRSDVARSVCCARCHREGEVVGAARLVAFSQQSCTACHKS